MGLLIRALEDPARPFNLRIANRLFGENTFAFEHSFLEWTKAAYGAALEPMNFKGAAEASRSHINAWIENRTEHRIQNLLPASSINADTRLVLVNAIYFHASWQEQFSENETAKAPFHLSPSSNHDVWTMHHEGQFRAAQAQGVRVLELPYQGGDAAMVIVLPDKIDGLAEVEQTLTAATIDTWTKAFRGKRRIIVSLPRFTFDPSVPLSLSNDLSALGMSAAFDANKADFSNISRPKQQNDRLSLSNVFHKAFVKVDEHGTEAAASTAVVTGLTAALRSEPPPPPLVFRADHPFLFLIIDKPSGLILFIGRVNDPSAI